MDTKIFLKSTSSVTVPFAWEGLAGKGFTINYVYNPLTLAYEPQQPAATGGGGTSDATAALQTAGNASLTSIDSKLTSQATATKQDTGNTSIANVDTNIGAKADSAASSDTGTFSLIALVKRLLQSLTTGNTTTASIDTKILAVKVSTSSCTNVSASASNASLLGSTAGRRAAYFYNDSTSDVYLKLGATASTTSFTVKIAAYGYFEVPQPVYTGAIDGIWTTATGSMRITELT